VGVDVRTVKSAVPDAVCAASAAVTVGVVEATRTEVEAALTPRQPPALSVCTTRSPPTTGNPLNVRSKRTWVVPSASVETLRLDRDWSRS
jgi:hypothetical protein